jgi:NADH:ubiquinone oxidoreductase subunit 4 (subunit M)
MGAALTALCTLMAVVIESSREVVADPRAARVRLAAVLALGGVLMAAWLASSLVTLAWALPLAPLLVMMLLSSDTARKVLALRVFVLLSLAALAILTALAYGVVERFNATRGSWTFILSALDAIVLPAASEPVVFAALVCGAWILLGAWPLHGWLFGLVERGPAALVVLVLGPYRWLGLWMLLTLGPALAGSTWFDAAPSLALVAAVGALISGVAAAGARALRALLARATGLSVGFAVVGVLGGSVQGIVGASVLVLAHGLASTTLLLASASGPVAMGPVALAAAGAPLFGVFTGSVLVLFGTVRFASPVLPGASWLAAILVLAAGAHALGLARLCATTEEQREARAAAPCSWAGGLVILNVAVLVVLGVAPQRWLGPASAAARARVDVLYRARCVLLVQGPAARARELDAHPVGCGAPVRRVIEKIARRGGDE